MGRIEWAKLVASQGRRTDIRRLLACIVKLATNKRVYDADKAFQFYCLWQSIRQEAKTISAERERRLFPRKWPNMLQPIADRLMRDQREKRDAERTAATRAMVAMREQLQESRRQFEGGSLRDWDFD
jgi:hypothetical protein